MSVATGTVMDDLSLALSGGTPGHLVADPRPVVSRRQATTAPNCELFSFIVSFALMGLTCAFGIAGNYLSVITLGRDRSLRTSVTKFLLTVLAVADMAFLLPVIVVIMLPAYCAYGKLRSTCATAVQQAIPYINQYGWAAASAAHTCTVYITVLVAVHRYIYVCCSHNAKRLSNLRRAKIHVAVVPLFAFCYSLPRAFEYQVHYPASNSTFEKPENLSNFNSSEIGVLQFTDVGSSVLFQYIYKNACYYLVMYIVPLSTLVFVTVRLLATIRCRSRASAAAVDKRSTAVHGRQQARDDSVTVVLVIVIVVFIVCQTPTLFQRLLLAITGNEALHCGHPYYYVEKLADYLAIFNSCVNFGIYVVFAPHFRRILLTDVMGFRRSRRSRRRRGEVDGGTRRTRGVRASARGSGAMIVNCVGKDASSAAATTTVSERTGDRCGSEFSGDRAYCSEVADCFDVSTPAQSSARERHQHQQPRQDPDDVVLNGVTGINSLPLKPLLSDRY